MNQEDTIAKLLLEMVPGPQGQLTQREILKALNRAYREGFAQGIVKGQNHLSETFQRIFTP